MKTRRANVGAARLHEALDRTVKRQARGCRKALKKCQRHFATGEVHALRVRFRRLMALLELPAVFLPGDLPEALQRRLKKALDIFDGLRDTQVQQQHLRGLLRAFPAARLYRDHLQHREQKAIRKAARRLRRLKTKRLWKELERLRRQVARRGRSADAAGDASAVSEALRAAFAATAQAQARERGNRPAAIHRTRIAFKKYRYLVEALAAWSGSSTNVLRQRLRAFQTLMGDIQDAEVLQRGAREFLRKNAVPPELGGPFLAALEAALERALQAYLAGRSQLHSLAPEKLQLPELS